MMDKLQWEIYIPQISNIAMETGNIHHFEDVYFLHIFPIEKMVMFFQPKRHPFNG